MRRTPAWLPSVVIAALLIASSGYFVWLSEHRALRDGDPVALYQVMRRMWLWMACTAMTAGWVAWRRRPRWCVGFRVDTLALVLLGVVAAAGERELEATPRFVQGSYAAFNLPDAILPLCLTWCWFMARAAKASKLAVPFTWLRRLAWAAGRVGQVGATLLLLTSLVTIGTLGAARAAVEDLCVGTALHCAATLLVAWGHPHVRVVVGEARVVSPGA